MQSYIVKIIRTNDKVSHKTIKANNAGEARSRVLSSVKHQKSFMFIGNVKLSDTDESKFRI